MAAALRSGHRLREATPDDPGRVVRAGDRGIVADAWPIGEDGVDETGERGRHEEAPAARPVVRERRPRFSPQQPAQVEAAEEAGLDLVAFLGEEPAAVVQLAPGGDVYYDELKQAKGGLVLSQWQRSLDGARTTSARTSPTPSCSG